MYLHIRQLQWMPCLQRPSPNLVYRRHLDVVVGATVTSPHTRSKRHAADNQGESIRFGALQGGMPAIEAAPVGAALKDSLPRGERWSRKRPKPA